MLGISAGRKATLKEFFKDALPTQAGHSVDIEEIHKLTTNYFLGKETAPTSFNEMKRPNTQVLAVKQKLDSWKTKTVLPTLRSSLVCF